MSLETLQQEFTAKQKALGKIFADKPDYDFTSDEVDDIQQRQKELDDIGSKLENAKRIKSIADNNNEFLSKMKKPVDDITFSNGKKGSDIADDEDELGGKSLGAMFVKSEAYTGFKRALGKGPSTDFSLKTVFATTTAAGGGTTGFAPEVTRVPGLVIDYKLRQPVMDSIIPSGRTIQQAVQYMEEQAPVNGAGWVTENDSNPRESQLTYLERTVPVRKVRISIPITDEMMEDAPMMMDFVNTRLMNLLSLEKDRALLSGSGNAPEILGVLNTPNIQTQDRASDPTMDAIYKAITKVSVNAFLDANHILIHPNDWQNVRLLRTPEGIYIFGSPLDPSPSRMWGLPVTVTQAMTQGTALVGAFDTSTQQFIRKDVTMTASNENNDNFMRGLLTIKLEMRMCLVVYRPAGIVVVQNL